MRHKGTRSRRFVGLLVALGVVGLGWLLVPAMAWADPGGTGHTLIMTEHTQGAFDPELDSPNPCNGADIVSAAAFGNMPRLTSGAPA